MATSSEFILAPRIDERKMREESKKMEIELRRTAKQAAEDFDFWMGKGFERGVETGGDKVKNKLKHLQGFLMLTGANLASEAVMAAAGVAKDIATKAFQGAEEYAQIARERLNDMSDISDTADALGINRGRYAALSAVGISARLDQSDLRGLLSGFVGALERPEMAAYKSSAEKNGIESSFLDFIGSMAKLTPEVAAQYMNQVFGDEDALLASRFMSPFKKMLANNSDLTFQNFVDTMMGGNVRTNELGEALNRGEGAAAVLSQGDAEAFQKRIIDGITQNQAKNIVDLDASEERRIQANIDVLDLKVKGKILADNAEIKVVNAERGLIGSAASYSQGNSQRWNALVEAGNQPINSLGAWSNFMDKLWDFGTYSPLKATTGKGIIGNITDYMDAKGASINQMMVDIAEKESQHNKNRGDVGALK